MNKYNRFMLMFAPDTGASGPAVIETLSAPGVEVPVLESPVTPEITDVTIANVETEGGVKSPADLFGEDSQALMDAADEKMGKKIDRERDENGKFLPKKEKEGAKPAAKVEPVKPEKPADVVPQMSTKVKIDDREMTPEEITAELKELRAKAESAKAPEKPVEVPADPKVEQERAAEVEKQRTERRNNFLTTATERYAIPETDLDKILVGGPEAVKALATTLAKVEMHSREAAAQMFNKEMDELEKRLTPILEREKTISQYQEENTALSAYPELKASPKGIEVYRTVKGQFDSSYQAIQAKGTAATPQERAWAAAYEAQTPEGLRDAIASHAKAELAKLTPAPSPNAKPAVIQQVSKPVVRPTKPFNGEKPGGISSPKAESAQDRFVRDMDMGG